MLERSVGCSQWGKKEHFVPLTEMPCGAFSLDLNPLLPEPSSDYTAIPFHFFFNTATQIMLFMKNLD